MPKQIRKRGRKHKPDPYIHERDSAEPPCVVLPVFSQQSSEQPVFADPPFGFVDPDLKTYLKHVDARLLDLTDTYDHKNSQDAADEEEASFLSAVLQEISGKELALATDADCSAILERILHLIDEFSLRVFMDRLSGSYYKLSTNRFASHVCQATFEAAQRLAVQELHGEHREASNAKSGDMADLRSVTELVADAIDELLPHVPEILSDRFASHVLRTILLLLRPSLLPAKDDSSFKHERRTKSSITSKLLAKQAVLPAFPSQAMDDAKHLSILQNESPFDCKALNILSTMRDKFGSNEIGIIATNPVASPTLELLLRLEHSFHLSSIENSLMDKVLRGMISQSHSLDVLKSVSDYLSSLIRDPIASRLLETVMTLCPLAVFDVVWSVHFLGTLTKLAMHPVCNFVIARCITRLSTQQFQAMILEMGDTWPKLIAASRSGVLVSVIHRAVVLEDETVQALAASVVKKALPDCRERMFVVDALYGASNGKNFSETASGLSLSLTRASIHAALILQNLLRIKEPYNQLVVQSIENLSGKDLIIIAQDPVASRVLDVLFESETVPHASKRKIGSRIGDRLWRFADSYSRERIASSLLDHEHSLLTSHYGKYFVPLLKLHILRRNPKEWRRLQQQHPMLH